MASADDVLALARAVAKPGGRALLINQDNTAGGWVPLEEAVSTGLAFAVEPKPGLIALDLDSPELVELGLRVKKWAEGRLNAQTVFVASGRDGHRHLWIRLPEDISEEDFREVLRANFDFPGESVRHRQATRPPLAPHRNAHPVALIAPETVSEALEKLGPNQTIPQSSERLRERYRRLLKDGDVAGKYRMPDGTVARHRLIAGIACRAVQAQIKRDAFVEDLLNPRNAASGKAIELQAERGPAFAVKYLQDTYDNVAKWIKEEDIRPGFDEEAFAEHMAGYRDIAERAPFPGKTGSADRDVLFAVIRLGLQHSSYSPMASIRDLHLDSGRSQATVRNALNRLVDRGWLTRGEPVGKTHTYIFNLEMSDKVSTYSTYGGTDRVCTRDVTHPVFTSQRALGGRLAEVWAKLPDSYVSIAEASKLTGLNAQTVRRSLKRLVAFGLAEIDEGSGPKGGDRYRCVEVGQDYLERLADELGIAEDKKLKREQVKRQRGAYGVQEAGEKPA
ncbi:hypothetical protein GCM10029978_102540 [Actinoallomurus acanthiterrae]